MVAEPRGKGRNPSQKRRATGEYSSKGYRALDRGGSVTRHPGVHCFAGVISVRRMDGQRFSSFMIRVNSFIGGWNN